ncbi:endonuclease III domain-containing protein [Botrimarina mediterranea]|uniref:Ultraviolet N-glycosylase/AP lyase n=1 Tax=Botrimarina mediterranea TaxID=2528022 RepID=A0A518KDS1_9BACT|nr:endonuclease III domain-containing protein [Botrimarina mediterranea]QDV75909.1 Ultraviolet N-glycosylase/AP lyase [Botrimarina mediterranea]QDV80504.1 Ultraviolet N-glycosylase/AP lyase [Planctomycetes bacterium K2D]
MSTIRLAYRLLHDAYGPQGWWPAATRSGVADAWEIAVGAVLVQHTSWKNVVRAIANLESAGAMSFTAIDAIEPEALAQIIRSAGPPNVKAKRLKAFARFLVESHGGSMDALLDGVVDRKIALERRSQLLGVHGVGPETADAILLYAGGAPLFVVDAYKRRVMRRHGWGDSTAKYDEVAAFWRKRLPNDVKTYAETHALLVRVGIEHCHASRAKCEGCPLQALLPNSGPLE